MEYLPIIGYSSLIVSPVLLCACFPAKKYIAKFQRELLTASLGTICGFIFFEIIPAILHDHLQHSFDELIESADKKTQLIHPLIHKLEMEKSHINGVYTLSCTILLGMIFAALLNVLHEWMEHEHCHQENDKDFNQASEKKGSCISCM